MAKNRKRKYQEGDRVRSNRPRIAGSREDVNPTPVPKPRPRPKPLKPVPVKPPIGTIPDDSVIGPPPDLDYWFTYTEEYMFSDWRPITYCIAFPDECPNFDSKNLDSLTRRQAFAWWNDNELKLTTGPITNQESGRGRSRDLYEYPGEHGQCPEHPSYLNNYENSTQYENVEVGEMPGGCWRKSYPTGGGNPDIGCCDDAVTQISNLFGMTTEQVLGLGYGSCETLDENGYMCGGCNCNYDQNSLYSFIESEVGSGVNWNPFNNINATVFYGWGPSCPEYHCVGGSLHGKMCDDSGAVDGAVTDGECRAAGGYGCSVGSGCSWSHKWNNTGIGGWNSHDKSCCDGCLNPKPYLLNGNDTGCESIYDTDLSNAVDWDSRFNYTETGGTDWVGEPIQTGLDYCLAICSRYGTNEYVVTNTAGIGDFDCSALSEAQCPSFETGDAYDPNDPYCLAPIPPAIVGGCCGWNQHLGQCVFKGGSRYDECASRCLNDYVSDPFCIDYCQPGDYLCKQDFDSDGICDDSDDTSHPDIPQDHTDCVGSPQGTFDGIGMDSYPECPTNCYDCNNECCIPGFNCARISGCDEQCGSTLVLDECGECGGDTTLTVCSTENPESTFDLQCDCEGNTCDSCGVCNGGNADIDCNGDCFGDAVVDDCEVCSGGNTGHIANSDDEGCGCFVNGPESFYFDSDGDGYYDQGTSPTSYCLEYGTTTSAFDSYPDLLPEGDDWISSTGGIADTDNDCPCFNPGPDNTYTDDVGICDPVGAQTEDSPYCCGCLDYPACPVIDFCGVCRYAADTDFCVEGDIDSCFEIGCDGVCNLSAPLQMETWYRDPDGDGMGDPITPGDFGTCEEVVICPTAENIAAEGVAPTCSDSYPNCASNLEDIYGECVPEDGCPYDTIYQDPNDANYNLGVSGCAILDPNCPSQYCGGTGGTSGDPNECSYFIGTAGGPLGTTEWGGLYDCNQDCGGSATHDYCDVCSGGNTGITPHSYDSTTGTGTGGVDCAGICPPGTPVGDTQNNYGHFITECGECVVAGTNDTNDLPGLFAGSLGQDCAGDCFGTAQIDACGLCWGGTGSQSNFVESLFDGETGDYQGGYDCAGICGPYNIGGQAFVDYCGECVCPTGTPSSMDPDAVCEVEDAGYLDEGCGCFNGPKSRYCKDSDGDAYPDIPGSDNHEVAEFCDGNHATAICSGGVGTCPQSNFIEYQTECAEGVLYGWCYCEDLDHGQPPASTLGWDSYPSCECGHIAGSMDSYCNGPSVGLCCNPDITNGSSPCVPLGTAQPACLVDDACGNCGGDCQGSEPNIYGCNGSETILGGCDGMCHDTSIGDYPPSFDSCGVCGGDNSTCADCNGDPNGGAVVDECGVCGGDNSTCDGCTDPTACNYDAGAVVDDGSCTYPETNLDCFGNCLLDVDCQGTCGGSAVEDDCGNCEGNFYSSYGAYCGEGLDGTEEGNCCDCAGVPNGDSELDECGECGGNNDCVDCAGVAFGDSYLVQCGVTAGYTLEVCGENTDDVNGLDGIPCGPGTGNDCQEVCTNNPNECTQIAGAECDCVGNVEDCAGECGGTHEIDVCERCAPNDNSVNYFGDNTINTDVDLCDDIYGQCPDQDGDPNTAGTFPAGCDGNCYPYDPTDPANETLPGHIDNCGTCGGECDSGNIPTGPAIYNVDYNQAEAGGAVQSSPGASGGCRIERHPDGSLPAGCYDCMGILDGPATYDVGGVCNGLGSLDRCNRYVGNPNNPDSMAVDAEGGPGCGCAGLPSCVEYCGDLDGDGYQETYHSQGECLEWNFDGSLECGNHVTQDCGLDRLNNDTPYPYCNGEILVGGFYDGTPSWTCTATGCQVGDQVDCSSPSQCWNATVARRDYRCEGDLGSSYCTYDEIDCNNGPQGDPSHDGSQVCMENGYGGEHYEIWLSGNCSDPGGACEDTINDCRTENGFDINNLQYCYDAFEYRYDPTCFTNSGPDTCGFSSVNCATSYPPYCGEGEIAYNDARCDSEALELLDDTYCSYTNVEDCDARTPFCGNGNRFKYTNGRCVEEWDHGGLKPISDFPGTVRQEGGMAGQHGDTAIVSDTGGRETGAACVTDATDCNRYTEEGEGPFPGQYCDYGTNTFHANMRCGGPDGDAKCIDDELQCDSLETGCQPDGNYIIAWICISTNDYYAFIGDGIAESNIGLALYGDAFIPLMMELEAIGEENFEGGCHPVIDNCNMGGTSDDNPYPYCLDGIRYYSDGCSDVLGGCQEGVENCWGEHYDTQYPNSGWCDGTVSYNNAGCDDGTCSPITSQDCAGIYGGSEGGELGYCNNIQDNFLIYNQRCEEQIIDGQSSYCTYSTIDCFGSDFPDGLCDSFQMPPDTEMDPLIGGQAVDGFGYYFINDGCMRISNGSDKCKYVIEKCTGPDGTYNNYCEGNVSHYDLGCQTGDYFSGDGGCVETTQDCSALPNACLNSDILQTNSQCSSATGLCEYSSQTDCSANQCIENVAYNDGSCSNGQCNYDSVVDCTDKGGCITGYPQGELRAFCACPDGTVDIEMRDGRIRTVCITDCVAAAPFCDITKGYNVGSYVPDGMCDYNCNVAECGYDGGDCCVDTCGEPGQSASEAKRYHWCDGRNEGGRDSRNKFVYHCIDPESTDRFGTTIDGVNPQNYSVPAGQNGTRASCPRLWMETDTSDSSLDQVGCIYHCQCGPGQYCDGYIGGAPYLANAEYSSLEGCTNCTTTSGNPGENPQWSLEYYYDLTNGYLYGFSGNSWNYWPGTQYGEFDRTGLIEQLGIDDACWGSGVLVGNFDNHGYPLTALLMNGVTEDTEFNTSDYYDYVHETFAFAEPDSGAYSGNRTTYFEGWNSANDGHDRVNPSYANQYRYWGGTSEFHSDQGTFNHRPGRDSRASSRHAFYNFGPCPDGSGIQWCRGQNLYRKSIGHTGGPYWSGDSSFGGGDGTGFADTNQYSDEFTTQRRPNVSSDLQ